MDKKMTLEQGKGSRIIPSERASSKNWWGPEERTHGECSTKNKQLQGGIFKMSEVLKLEEQEETFEEEPEEEAEEAQDDHFVVDDDSKASWCLDKIREVRDDTEIWKAHFANQLAKIEQRNKETEARMIEMLEAYFKTVPHRKSPTQESYPLKGGKLVFKKQQPEYDHDDEKLVPWLKQNAPELVKVVESSEWGKLKKRCVLFNGEVADSETGEVIPGVTATPRPDIFKVEVK